MRTLIVILALVVSASAAWIRQTVDTKAGFRGLSVVSSKVIWASGTGGTVIRTIDGGKSWNVLKVPDADKLDFRDIEAFDANTAYILSIGNGDASRIYKTTDGGKSWKLQFKNDNKDAFFDAFAFWGRNRGIAMSDPVDGEYLLIETVDGKTWRPLKRQIGVLQTQLDGVLRAGKMRPSMKAPIALKDESAFAASGTCIIAQGKSNVFLISGGGGARVFFSPNFGQEWTVDETPIQKGEASKGIFSIAMRDVSNGVIVGGNYQDPKDASNGLAFTSDGGVTWTPGGGLGGYRSGIAYIDASTLVAVGTNGSDLSSNGGKTWKALDSENYNAVAAKGWSAVWAVGPNGMVAKLSK